MSFSFLPKTSVWAALSPLGKSIETPKGIFHWSSRAKKEAEIDGTIGVAQDDDGAISHLRIAEEWAGASVSKRAPNGKVFGYAPIEGVLSLRQKWLAKMLERSPVLAPHSSLPVVTNGITHSLALAGRLFLEKGETLLTADKSWENYSHIFEDVQELKIAPFPLFTAEGGFHIDAIIGGCRETAALQKKVVLLLNFPHNQTGFMPTHEDAQLLGRRIQELCKEMPEIPFVVLLDDAYEGYVYDQKGQKHSMLAEIFAPLPNLTVAKLDGISKVMLAYGYRIGFLTLFGSSLNGVPFSQEFLGEFRDEVGSKIGGFVRGEISQANHHGQILADALMDEWGSVSAGRAEIIKMLQTRWQIFMEAFQVASQKYGKEKIWMDLCNGGFFCYLNLAEGLDAKDVADRLLKEKRVGVVPGPHGLRVAFAGVPKEKIPRMVEAFFEIIYA